MIDKNLLIGLALQIGSILLAYISVRILYAIAWLFVLVVCVPLFLSSPFYLINANLPLIVRLMLSFWIVAFPIYHGVMHALDWRHVRTEAFLIPHGYHGLVTVKQDQRDGVPMELDGETVVFRIGPSGILMSQTQKPTFKYREGDDEITKRREYYWISASGEKTKLEYRMADVIPPDQVNWYYVPPPKDAQDYDAFHILVGTDAEFYRYLDGLK